MRASGVEVATIRGARVVVIAQEHVACNAFPDLAEITHGTDISIGAWSCVVDMLAAQGDITTVIGAGVAVIAVGRSPRGAGAFLASIADGAGILVSARGPFVGRHQAATAGNGVT